LEEKNGAEVELVKGTSGVFEITVDGKLAFSKKQLGRFPEDAEIDALGTS
jgi:selenoprotein W-related protein